MKIMKKLLLIIGIITICSCSSSDEETKVELEVNLNPPEWIIGTWISQDVGSNDFGWKFETNNAIQIVEGGDNGWNLKETATGILNGYDDLTNQNQVIVEDITNDSYSVKVTFYDTRPSMITYFTYKFVKISDTEIQWVTAPTSINPLTMTKQ